jgi:hypothetical protein
MFITFNEKELIKKDCIDQIKTISIVERNGYSKIPEIDILNKLKQKYFEIESQMINIFKSSKFLFNILWQDEICKINKNIKKNNEPIQKQLNYIKYILNSKTFLTQSDKKQIIEEFNLDFEIDDRIYYVIDIKFDNVMHKRIEREFNSTEEVYDFIEKNFGEVKIIK